jgi:hypothetical protein
MKQGVAQWADRCARNNPPQKFHAQISKSFRGQPGKYRLHKLSGEETIAKLLKLGVSPDDIEVIE